MQLSRASHPAFAGRITTRVRSVLTMLDSFGARPPAVRPAGDIHKRSFPFNNSSITARAGQVAATGDSVPPQGLRTVVPLAAIAVLFAVTADLSAATAFASRVFLLAVPRAGAIIRRGTSSAPSHPA